MKTVVLIDHTTGGHHLAFMRLFAQALLNLNHRVVVLIPESEKVSSWDDLKGRTNLIALDFEETYPEIRISNRFNAAIENLFKWKNVANKIKAIEKKYQIKVDLVFFAWLDSYLANYLHPALLNLVFPYKWSGLYFHPRHLRLQPESLGEKPALSDIDIVLTSVNCQNIAIHDEGIIDTFSSRLQGKKVILFPEIADLTPPDQSYELANEILKKANKRIVIGVIGLEKRKGILTLIELAKRADPKGYFFVLIGKLNLSQFGYSTEEQEIIYDFINSKQENSYFFPEPVEEGGKFNAVLNTFDIPFIVYNEFPSSSNILTKAAYFKKFVLASERFCIGEDVKKYELGITVEEGNVDQCLKAIDTIRQQIQDNKYPRDQSKIYSGLHSKSVLAVKFQEIISDL